MYMNYPGHMTKMAAMRYMYIVKTLTNLPPEPVDRFQENLTCIIRD